MESIIPDTPASIDQGLSSDAAKRWDDVERINREKSMQIALSELHQSQTALAAAVTVSIDEDSEDTFSVGSFEDNLNSYQRLISDISNNSNSLEESNKENIPSYNLSNLSSDIIPQDPPLPYASTESASHGTLMGTGAPKLASDSSTALEGHPLIQAHIQSLEFQVAHLQTQNHSLRNTINRDQRSLEHLSYSNSQSMEQLHLMKAHFQHLLPPPSSDSDPSLSNSDSILPTLPELRGEQLHETKMILMKKEQEVNEIYSQLNRIKQESKHQIKHLAAQNQSLKVHLETANEKLKKHISFRSHSSYGDRDQIRVENHLQKQLHNFEGQVFTLTQDLEQRKIREEVNLQSIHTLQHERDHQREQIDLFKKQQKKDQSEIATLLEQRNALRGQLDEIQLQSGSNGKSLDSQFQSEIHRLQTSHTRTNKILQNQLSSLQSTLNEKTKVCKESQHNESASLQRLEDVKKGCNILIQTLFHLQEKKLLFQSKNATSVEDMINYAWRGMPNIHMNDFFNETVQKKFDSKNSEFHEISTQTHYAYKTSGSNTNEDEIYQIQKEQEKEQRSENQHLISENRSLQARNQMLQDQLQQSVDENIEYTRSQNDLVNEVDRFTQENNTLQLSKQCIQEENQKLVEKRVEVEKLLVNVQKENSFLIEKSNLNNNVSSERSAYKKKLQKLKKDLDYTRQERDYWEQKAIDEKKQSKPFLPSRKELQKVLPTISFDQSSIMTFETGRGSLSFMDSPQIAPSNRHKQINAIDSHELKKLKQNIEELQAALLEKETIIVALTEHIDSKSKLLKSSSPYPTIDNEDIPLHEWLQSWESTMDQHIVDTTETVTNALSSALHLLVDDLLQQDQQVDIQHKNMEGLVINDIETHAQNLAKGMEEVMQEGLTKIQIFSDSREKEKESIIQLGFKMEGEALQSKLKNILECIECQKEQFGIPEMKMNEKKLGSDASKMSNKKKIFVDGIETDETKDLISKRESLTSKESRSETNNFVKNCKTKHSLENKDEILVENLLQLLQNVDNKSNKIKSMIQKSDTATEIDIIPGMAHKAVDAFSPIIHKTKETNTPNQIVSEENDTLKQQLTKAISRCSQLLSDKKSLEMDLERTKEGFQSKLEKFRQDKENEIKFYKLHLDSSFPFRQLHENRKVENDITMQDRLHRIRRSAERADLISKHEEEQAALISECNNALRAKIGSFNDEVNKAVETNLEDVKKDRDEFIHFACVELKKEYNEKIENLFQRHQKEIEKVCQKSRTLFMLLYEIRNDANLSYVSNFIGKK